MFISDQFGFNMAFIYVSLLLVTIFSFLMLFVKDSAVRERVTETVVDIWKALVAKIVDFLRELRRGFFQSGPGPIFGVAFALLPVGAMALSGAVASTLQVDIGMSDNQIAQLNVYGTVLSGIGCVVGGWAADRWGQRSMLALWYAMTTLPTLYIAWQIAGPAGLAGLTINHYFAGSLVFAFCMGMHYGTGAAIFMGLTNPLVAATQFTGYMALKNLTTAYTNFWQGYVADAFDYATVMYIDSALVALPLLVIPFLKPARSPQPTLPPNGTSLQKDG
jgi:PAT family beta-lactamase induction signal transducer AmpG